MRWASLLVCIVLLSGAAGGARSEPLPDPGDLGPYTTASITLTITNPDNGDEIEADVHYPSAGDEIDPANAPYATLVFARGFLSSSGNYAGNGHHLASWGYIVLVADFPSEDIEARADDVQYLLSYLEAENTEPTSIFYNRIDTSRFGVLGHSLGGLTTLMVAARDPRVQVAVALDPVNPPEQMNTPWDYAAEAPQISAPLAVIGAPSQGCNSSANYNSMYPVVGSDHKTLWVLDGGNHCDFVDFPPSLVRTACYTLCALLGGGQYSAERVQLARRYTTAWLNYYLRGQTEYFSYLYGADAEADIQSNLVTRNSQTAPQDVVAEGQPGAVLVSWTLPTYPIIAGYNIYRSTQSGEYPGVPIAAGRVSSYEDLDVVGGTRYYYVVRSRDAAGNEHQPSGEVNAAPMDDATPTATATVTPTTTVTTTPTVTATSTATPSVTITPSATTTWLELWLPLLLAK